MAYWWASQGKNYPIAIEQGTLWTCPWYTGRVPTDRKVIQDIRRGDVVFHHEHKMIRAVSVAVAEWRDAPRPEGYPKKRDEDLDVGWLVRVQPIDMDVRIPADVFIDVIAHGAPGPLNKNGVVAQQYLSPLTPAEGDELLRLAGLSDLSTDLSLELPTDAAPGVAGVGGSTDTPRAASARVEQAALRAFLLGGSAEVVCGLCGRVVPREFVVAGHIKPRALCTDDERWDFAATAMPFCLLGCDVIFENRYVTVTEGGLITAAKTCGSPAVRDALAALIGERCVGFTEQRSVAFADHARLALGPA
jgi:hypothetical protein